MADGYEFGNENAFDDELLYRCAVDLPSLSTRLPIIRGRWGAGKTAQLLIRNKALSDALERRDKKYKYIWYIYEAQIVKDFEQYGTLNNKVSI